MAEEAKHTPGPWEYAPEGDSDGETVGTDHIVIANHGAVELCCAPTEADARLIAAAPDLLAACKRFLLYHATDHPGLAHLAEFKRLREAMESAVAKAEGGAA